MILPKIHPSASEIAGWKDLRSIDYWKKRAAARKEEKEKEEQRQQEATNTDAVDDNINNDHTLTLTTLNNVNSLDLNHVDVDSSTDMESWNASEVGAQDVEVTTSRFAELEKKIEDLQAAFTIERNLRDACQNEIMELKEVVKCLQQNESQFENSIRTLQTCYVGDAGGKTGKKPGRTPKNFVWVGNRRECRQCGKLFHAGMSFEAHFSSKHRSRKCERCGDTVLLGKYRSHVQKCKAK